MVTKKNYEANSIHIRKAANTQQKQVFYLNVSPHNNSHCCYLKKILRVLSKTITKITQEQT